MAESRHPIQSRYKFTPVPTVAKQRLASQWRELVVTPPTLAGLLHPLAFHQALAFQPVKHRIQRRDVELQLTVRLRFNQLGNLVPVPRTLLHESQHHHLGAALLQVPSVDISCWHIWLRYI